jgi:hypothetical protein
MDDLKPPAPPVGADTFAPAAPQKVPLPEVETETKSAETKPAKRTVRFYKNPVGPLIEAAEDAEKERQKLHAELRAHLLEANQLDDDTVVDELHPHVHEHALLRGYDPIKVLDPETMKWVDRPCWQMQALVAHFHAHGLRHDSRISDGMFERALHDVLHGRA